MARTNSPSRHNTRGALGRRHFTDRESQPFREGLPENTYSLTMRGRTALRWAFSAAGIHISPEDRSLLPRAHLMCLLCSHTGMSGAYRNPLTGLCYREKTCSERRAELDDETIEFLGLIPREGTAQ